VKPSCVHSCLFSQKVQTTGSLMRRERATFTSSPLVSFPIIVQHRSFRTAKEKKKKRRPAVQKKNGRWWWSTCTMQAGTASSFITWITRSDLEPASPHYCCRAPCCSFMLLSSRDGRRPRAPNKRRTHAISLFLPHKCRHKISSCPQARPRHEFANYWVQKPSRASEEHRMKTWCMRSCAFIQH
jgi:hypothetical protein